MSNDVQTHERAGERAAGEERRASVRHAAASLGSVTARIIGGSQVELVNYSSRGVLFECDSRLLIGARASVRITTADANLIVTGRVVRSRVKGLVNGALRYDAALFLDTDLGLAPVVPVNGSAHSPATAETVAEDGDVSFESDVDPSFDPSVEAYLAASEASLAEVAGAVDPVDSATAEAIAAIDAAVAEVEATPFQVETAPEFETAAEFDAAAEFEAAPEFEAVAEFEVAPEFEAAVMCEAPAEFDAPAEIDVAVEAAALPPPLVVETAALPPPLPVATAAVAEDEPIAFEADGDITFEPAVEFSFDEVAPVAEASAEILEVPPPVVDEEPAGTSMFDSTPYVPPIEDAPSSLTPFVVTPPTAVVDVPVSSMFDSRPSESYGEVAVTATPESASEDVAFESEIAFEAEDAVMFEAAFEEPVPEAVAPALEADAAEPVVDAAAEPVVEAATDVLVEVNVVLEPATDEPVEAAEPMLDGVDPIDVPAAVPSGDDRVLLQFAATVPQDLAELRRIAADNQW